MDNDDIITINIDDYVTSTINISTISLDEEVVFNSDTTFDWGNITITPVEFEDCMPDVAKVEDMCRDYPAMAKAYENFKTVYKLIDQHWIGRQKEDE